MSVRSKLSSRSRTSRMSGMSSSRSRKSRWTGEPIKFKLKIFSKVQTVYKVWKVHTILIFSK